MPRIVFVAATVLIAATVSFHPASSSGQQDTNNPEVSFQSEANLVSVYFTVRDGKRRLVTNLRKEQFRAYEEGREQSIRFFSHHSDVPLNLGVLLDTSTSLPRLLGLEAEAANQFLRRVLRPNDLAFVVSYRARVEILQVPTAQLELLEEKVQSIRAFGGTEPLSDSRSPSPPGIPWPTLPGRPPLSTPTPGWGNDPLQRVAKLYDALELSASRFLSKEIGRKAVVIVALADDAGSDATLENALLALHQNDVIAYVLQVDHGPQVRTVRDRCDVLHIFSSEPPNRIGRLAEETGGRVLKVQGFDRLQAAFEEIGEELHNQYSLGYRPANQQWDGHWRRIRIRARGGNYHIQSRKGYYATPRHSP